MVDISDKRYEELIRAELMLQALDETGVDNWEWYSEALAIFDRLLKEEGTSPTETSQ